MEQSSEITWEDGTEYSWEQLIHHKKMQGINPMGLCAPLDDTYLFNHKTSNLSKKNMDELFLCCWLKQYNEL